MDIDFWLQKWENNTIAFHKSEANPMLVQHFQALSLAKGSRVFLPLCGKTLDIAWLLANGYRVVGAELIEIAIEQLFIELGEEPQISEAGAVKRYSTDNIDIWVGNIFDVSNKRLGAVDAVYDRAALVALPQAVRAQYTMHLKELTNKAPQLLISYEYDQNLMAGPPFSISNEEVKQHYEESYHISLLASIDVPGGLKGQCAAKENVWLLKNS